MNAISATKAIRKEPFVNPPPHEGLVGNLEGF